MNAQPPPTAGHPRFSPWMFPGIVVLALVLSYSLCRVRLVDDAFDYLAAARAPVEKGRIDLTPTGFHGSSLAAAPIYAVTRSDHAVAWLGIGLSLLNPLLLLLVARRIGGDRAGAVAALFYLLLPGVIWEPMKGHINTIFVFFLLVTILLSIRMRPAAPLAWGYAVIVKPFAAALLPLFAPDAVRTTRRRLLLAAGCLIPVVYVAITRAQTGEFATAYSAAAGEPGIAGSLSLNLPKNAARTALNLFVAGDWNVAERYGTVRAIAPPSLAAIGLWALWRRRRESLARRAAAAVGLNLLMVMLMNHLFAKYLLPALLLLAVFAAATVAERPWLGILIGIDAFQLAYLRAKLVPPETIGGVPAAVPLLLPWAVAVVCLAALAIDVGNRPDTDPATP